MVSKLLLLIFLLASTTAFPRSVFTGMFGKVAFILSDEVSVAITEGEILSMSYGVGLKDDVEFPFLAGVYSSMVFGQEGKSKFSLVPRITWEALGEDFKPFIFSASLGAGVVFPFLVTNNYASLVSHWVIATDIDLGEGVSIGGESIIEIPFNNSSTNPPNISVLFRVVYRG